MATPKKAQRKGDAVELKLLPLSELKRWDRNPKDHDIGLLIHSLKTYGLVRPPAISTATDKLLYGHGLSEALELMKADGEDAPRRVAVDKKTGEWLIPTNLVDLEEPLHEPYLVIDNRSTELGGWDYGILPSILTELVAEDRLEITGFDADDLDSMIRWNEGEAFPGHREVDESVADSVEMGCCPSCRVEFPLGHARKLWLNEQKQTPDAE